MRQMKEDRLSYKNMKFVKEQIARGVNENYYRAKENYSKVWIEIYARLAGKRETTEYLKEFRKEGSKSIYDNYDLRIKSEVKLLKESRYRVNNKAEDYLGFNSQFRSMKSEDRKEYFSEYPMLAVEYNEDGSMKDIMDVVHEVEKRVKEANDNGKTASEFFERNATIANCGELYDYIQQHLIDNYALTCAHADELKSYNSKNKIFNMMLNGAVDKSNEILNSKSKQEVAEDLIQKYLNFSGDVSCISDKEENLLDNKLFGGGVFGGEYTSYLKSIFTEEEFVYYLTNQESQEEGITL